MLTVLRPPGQRRCVMMRDTVARVYGLVAKWVQVYGHLNSQVGVGTRGCQPTPSPKHCLAFLTPPVAGNVKARSDVGLAEAPLTVGHLHCVPCPLTCMGRSACPPATKSVPAPLQAASGGQPCQGQRGRSQPVLLTSSFLSVMLRWVKYMRVQIPCLVPKPSLAPQYLAPLKNAAGCNRGSISHQQRQSGRKLSYQSATRQSAVW
jgi:hypothetical protein